MKFGGTSVANSEAITRTISIVKGKLSERPIVVVSALSKVTDLLYKIADQAASRNKAETEVLLAQLRARHTGLAHELLSGHPALCAEACAKIDSICDELESFVGAVCSIGELSDRSKAVIIGNGEYLSSNIICCAMKASGIRTGYVDARSMIVTDSCYLKGEPDSALIEEGFRRTGSSDYAGIRFRYRHGRAYGARTRRLRLFGFPHRHGRRCGKD